MNSAAALSPPSSATVSCLHCGNALGARGGEFCCAGCEVVYSLIASQGLARYYDLGGGRGNPATVGRAERRDRKWLEAIEARVAGASGPERIDLDVQGLHCTGCVWLIDELYRRTSGGARIVVNPAIGRIELVVHPSFALRRFVESVESFGYLFGPALKTDARHRQGGLLVRMGICIAIAMNTMIFGIAIYAGLSRGPVFRLFEGLNFWLSLLSVIVGGSVFFESAWGGLRRRILHLDLPIALGILLAFTGSTVAYVGQTGGASYFDTLNVFIALMLVGRFLQERVLEKNRRYLLASEGAEGLLTRKVSDQKVLVVRCGEVKKGDLLLIAPFDLVPVPSTLQADRASFSLDWISGESEPVAFGQNEIVPAGAFSRGPGALTVRATVDFAESPLTALLRTPLARPIDAARQSPSWQRFTKLYVSAVLALAAIAFALWMTATGDVRRALDVVTAVLIVTCPCAFGIATPLAYELCQAGLRRAGLFVRSSGFLDRACAVRKIVFDKTGTLTTGSLVVESRGVTGGLSADEKSALYNLAVRSTHPKSLAVKAALDEECVFRSDVVAEDRAGLGVVATIDGTEYRLGSPAWIAPGEARAEDVAFSSNGVARAFFTTGEELRPDAAFEVASLVREGYDVRVLSGDVPARVTAIAASCGLAADRAIGGQGPEAKAAWLGEHDRGDTLMIGDGLNDSLVVERAFCSGTPAIDRPFMAARSDFYFITPGLGPIRAALRVAKRLHRVVRRNLALALAYNVIAVGLAYAGWMSPLLCAVLMPLSSLTTVLTTTMSLSARSALWRS